VLGTARCGVLRAPATRGVLRATLIAVGCLWPTFAGAQAANPVPGRLAVGGGVRWTGRTTIGAADATETTPGGGRFQLFRTNTSIGAALGIESRIGLRLTRTLEAEVDASFTQPALRTAISADAEGATAFTAAESMKEIAVEGALILHLARMRLSARAIPYLSAGAGLVRRLHEGGTLAENGRVYHVGAGLQYFLKSSATGGVGVRLDGRAIVRSGDTSIDGDLHVSPAVAASLFARF
jgi:opacity protein-like surface antigen